MLGIITKKSHHPFLEFSWSAALYVFSFLARTLLSLPNSTALLSLHFVPRQSREALRGSHVGLCAAVTWALRGSHVGRCAAVLRNPVAHRLLIGRQPLRGRHVGCCAAVTWDVVRPLRGRCAAVLRNPVAHHGRRCFDGRFSTSSRPQIRPWSSKAQSSPGITNESSSKSQQVTVVDPRPTNHFVECFLNEQTHSSTTQNIFIDFLPS